MMERTTYDHVEDVLLHLPPEEAKGCVTLLEWPEEVLRDISRALVVQGQAIAIGGVHTHLDDRYLIAWSFLTAEARALPVTVTKWAKACIDEIDMLLRPRRLEMSVRSDTPNHKDWAEVLGLHEEGLMRSYGPDGSDYIRMARVRE